MYTTFLKALGEIAEHLDAAAKVGGSDNLTPYLNGAVEVRLEGERVGEFRFEDEWVTYYPDSPEAKR